MKTNLQLTLRTYEPIPEGKEKSFYGKCKIIETKDGYSYLKSYKTIVAYKDSCGNIHRTWKGYTATSGRHLRAIGIMNKKEWDSLPVEKLPENHPFWGLYSFIGGAYVEN